MYARLLDRREVLNPSTFTFMNQLVFEVDANDIKGGLPTRCELTIDEWSPDRNENQNSKYWKTVGDIARLTGTSKTVVHNQLLNDYGELELFNGEPIVVVMKESYDYLTDEDLHLSPTGKSFTSDGMTYNIYYKLINSKNLTKKQFSRLLDGALYEREELK